MASLFENLNDSITFDLPDAEIVYYPHIFSTDKSDDMFRHLLDGILWQQDDITLFGKTHAQPRLTALYGNQGKPYSYSGIVMKPHPWNALLTYIKEEVEQICGFPFTTVLLNQYRDGKDSNGWHADDEKELGRNPVIASVSFGTERFFHLKHNTEPEQKLKILLESGSLLLMKGTTQHFWKHQIPKTTKPIGTRINLTFRAIK
ncbi:alpha-ketoglutarate-dependent dioxygenase AlkB family protein [Flavobacterium pallidum]|uniref:Alpha-ketoglutarate-dependent dioxygenase AlkB n=1 Tax=Flavobacterium pallidum TaxID=2172098 RepID=A0A2S1SH19_9FLAO|nr:alpha-ketoglutarate-dependent dioxygenase AlkB [Flavobacterium pallidum]AWI25708.1 alpha-ketoglutarate-dependent dioxygenase AlkB [Flavobacterium pallidum]